MVNPSTSYRKIIMAGFSSNEIQIMERQLDVESNFKITNMNWYYELDRCANWIRENKLKKVCLQFPDRLLHDSVKVSLLIEGKVGLKPYILADTSYGSCCVDMLAAQHVRGDGIIHFGHACLSPFSGLPVLYIFEKLTINTSHFVSVFRHMFEDRNKKILLFYDVGYQHAIDAIVKDISSEYCHLVVTTLATSSVHSCNEKERKILGRIFTLLENSGVEEYSIMFIGKDGPMLSNIILTLKGESVYIYDPSGANQLEMYTATNTRFLMRRLYFVERVKDATTLGILVGTLGICNYLEAVNRIKQLAKQRGKKCYIIAVGKPNIAKLANFPEIEVFVLVACPEISLLNSKEFFRPIVTPYEVELACNPSRTWTENYVLEFQNLLSGGSDYQKLAESVADESVDVSLVSGRVRTMAVAEPYENVDTDTIAIKTDGTLSTVLSSGSKFLAERSWQGLQINLEQDEACVAAKGRSGIPSSYDTDCEATKD